MIWLAAWCGGRAARAARQPALVGEILAGVLVGPAVFGWLPPGPALHVAAQAGVFAIAVLAGLEMSFHDMRRTLAGRALFIPVCGFLVPAGFGLAAGAWLGLPPAQRQFLAVCVAVTALPVIIRILRELGMLNTAIGRTVVSAAILDDVVALALVGALVGAHGATGAPGPQLAGAYAVIAAFFVSLAAGRAVLRRAPGLLAAVRAVSGWLAPLFFIQIGLALERHAVDALLVAAVFAVGVAGKVLGGYLGTRLAGGPHAVGLAVGVGLNARGVMELLVASLGLQQGIIGLDLYAALVIMGVATTLMTPWWFRRVHVAGA